MANDTIKKVLEIKVNYEKAIKEIARYREGIKEAKQAQKKLTDELKAGEISQDKYNQEMEASRLYIKQQSNSIAIVTKQIQKQITIQNEQEGSLKQLRAELSNLTAEYDALSAAERNGAQGEELKNHINEVTDALKEGEEATQRYYRNVGNYKESVNAAFASLTDKVAEARKEYQELLKVQGDGTEAVRDAKDKYEALTSAMDFTAQAATGMTNSVMGFVTGGNKSVQAAVNIATSLKDTKAAFILAGEGAKILGKQLLALMANPIVAFLGLVSAAIMVLVRGIRSSEENLRKWDALMAPIQRGLAALENEIQQLSGVLIDFMQAISNTANIFLTLAGAIPGAAPALDFLGQAIKRFVAGPVYTLINGLQKANETYKMFIAWAAKVGKDLPALGGALEKVNRRNQEAIELANEKHDIFEQESEDIKANAAAEEEVQRLRQQAKDQELYTAQQRMEFIKRANELEEEQAARNVDLAKRKFKAAKAEAEWAGNTAATNRELAELEADVSRARMAYFQKTHEIKEQERAINRELAAEEKQQLSERKKANDEAAKIAQERIDKEREAIRQSEDELLKLVKDSAEQHRRQIEQTYSREIEDLRRRLETEKNLTSAARDAIRQIIEAKERQQAEALQTLEAEISAKRIARRQQEIDLMLSAIKEGTEEEYRLKREQLQANMDADIAAAEREIRNTEELEKTKNLIRAKYLVEGAKLDKEQRDRVAKEQVEALKNRMAEQMSLQKTAQNEQMQMLIEKGATEQQLQLQQTVNNLENLQTSLTQEKEMLARMKQEEGETLEAYNARRAEAEQSISEKSLQIAETEAAMKQQAYENITSAIDAMGEHSKAFAKLSKVLALAEIAINTGKALAAGVAEASTVHPWPAMLAAIATTVATVLANIATAVSTVKSAKFAKGGKVRGAGTGTSDSIPAQLSNGEYVVNAQSTKLFEPLLEAINGFRIPVPVSRVQQIQQMRDAGMVQGIKTALVEVHPVVSVVEVTEAQNRVKLIENVDNY